MRLWYTDGERRLLPSVTTSGRPTWGTLVSDTPAGREGSLVAIFTDAADAVLAVAAPHLLAACEHVLAEQGRGRLTLDGHTENVLRAAVAKARKTPKAA